MTTDAFENQSVVGKEPQGLPATGPGSPVISHENDIAAFPGAVVVGGETDAGFETLKARMSPPNGDYWVDWQRQIDASPNGCVAIQTGSSALDRDVIANMEAAGRTAGWDAGQVLVGKDAESYFGALSDVARNRLALMLKAQAGG